MMEITPQSISYHMATLISHYNSNIDLKKKKEKESLSDFR